MKTCNSDLDLILNCSSLEIIQGVLSDLLVIELSLFDKVFKMIYGVENRESRQESNNG